MITVLPVPAQSVARRWQQVAPMLDAALPYAQGRFTLQGIYDDLEDGSKDLWAFYRGAEIIGAVVTVYTDFPALKLCTVLLCGGNDIDEWKDQGLDAIERAALRDGCSQIEIVGRPGWRRKCASYDHAGDWLVKNLRAA